MASPSLKEILDYIKELRAEDTKFLESYSSQIEVLKQAVENINSQKKSWINRHKWFIVTIAVILVVFVAPLVMKHNNICQFNIKLDESIGFQSCK